VFHIQTDYVPVHRQPRADRDGALARLPFQEGSRLVPDNRAVGVELIQALVALCGQKACNWRTRR
jgi:hypothetical protein